LRVQITSSPKLARVDHLFILVAEHDGKKRTIHARPEARKMIEAAIAESNFTGRADEALTFLRKDGPRKVTLIGVGKESAISHRAIKAGIYAIAKAAKRARDKSIAVMIPYALPGIDDVKGARLVYDLLAHSDYRYDAWISKKDSEPSAPVRCIYIAPPALDARAVRRVAAEGEAIADAVRTVRDLGNSPGNEMTPESLGERARAVAAETGVKCTVYDLRAIERMKMGGLLAVNQGSDKEPRFIVLEYEPAKKAKKTVCLVGKGITFARLRLPVRVIGLIPSTENLPSGSAYKPGDIVRTRSGKTIEVINTDAEGRVILADALDYAGKYKPDHLLDFATLTGACVVALGHEATGLFANDDMLAQKLIESGERVGERLWRLPEWDEYKEYIRSDWADMKNSGGRWGGASTAAVFLKEFVTCPSWAHLDIAGTAWTDHDTGREGKGATGAGVRMTIDFLESLV
jgi:leucyl aminopeptidase